MPRDHAGTAQNRYAQTDQNTPGKVRCTAPTLQKGLNYFIHGPGFYPVTRSPAL